MSGPGLRDQQVVAAPSPERAAALRQAGLTPCVQAVLAIDGSLRPDRLRRAAAETVARHSMLHGGRGLEALAWTTSDMALATAAARDEVRERRLRDQRRVLATGMSNDRRVHAHLISWSSDSHDLALTMAAHGADAGTMSACGAEIVRACSGDPMDDPLPYGDVVAWQLRLADQERADPARLYWELCRELPATEDLLPFEEVTTEARPHRSEFVIVEDDDAVCQRADRAAREIGCSWPGFLLACWQALFWRLGRRVPLTGGVVPARKYPELTGVVGPLDRTVPIQSRARDDTTVASFARAADRAWQGAVEWQEYYEWQRAGIPPGHVYGLGFAHIVWPAGWSGGAVRASLTTPRVDVAGARLTLNLCEIGDRRVVSLQFDGQAFTGAAVRRLARLWAILVGDAAARPHATLDALSLLTSGERDQVLRTWNATDRSWPDSSNATVASWLDAQAARTPEAVAVSMEDEVWTYAELHDRANRIANRLLRLGVGCETRVAVWMTRSPLNVAALVGVWKAGAAYVPLDPDHPSARLAFQIEDAGATVVLTDAACLGAVPSGPYTVDVLDASDAAWRSETAVPPPRSIEPEQLAYTIYTSGSTGTPKGVEIDHRMLGNVIGWYLPFAAIGTDARMAHLTPQGFDAVMLELWPCLTSGGRVCLPPRRILGDPAALWAWFTREGVTHVCTVPQMWTALAAEPIPSASALRWLNIGGDRLAHGLERRLPFKVANLYGPTETTIIVTGQLVHADAPPDLPPPIGRPFANTRTYVLDRAGQPVPVGHIGELYVGGVQVARGYCRRPDSTAERFVPDPFGPPGGRLYRTGDLVQYRADGALEFIGRRDHQVKLRGYRIELGEIEAAVRQLPGIRHAAVVVREEVPHRRRLVAYVVTATDAIVSIELLQEGLAERLPDYMVPRVWVVLDALPLTSSGKIDRRRLPDPDAARESARDDVRPRTPAEEIVAGIWEEVLRRPRVDVRDSFLAIGGDSLSAMQVLARLREAFGRDIPMRVLFEQSTLEAQAERLLRPDGDGGVDPPIERALRDRPLPASFGQERLWVVDRVTGSQGYHVLLTAQVAGHLDERAFAAAVSALAARHEVLRTTIGVVDGRPVQEIAPPGEIPVPCIDLEWLDAAGRTRAIDAVRRTLERSPFDVHVGPLWRATIVRIDSETNLLACILHHIVADGWSVGILVRDLSALYQAARAGLPAPLPELPVQYADYAAWQRRVLTPERQASDLAYWRAQLNDVAPLALPTDRPRGPLPGVRGGVVTRQWDAAFSRDVQTWTRAQSATLFMVLVAAWQALLGRYAGRRDVAVGTPIAQRPRPELEPLIGFFLNTLVIRTPVDSAESWATLVSRVRSQALGAYAHQTVPFEHIIEELQPARDLARTPFFEVMFVFQNNPEPSVSLGGLQLTPLEARTDIAIYDLVLEAASQPDGIGWVLRYDASLFDRSTAERMLQHLEAFARAAIAAPDAPIGTLSILSDAERQQMYAPDRFPRALGSTPRARAWSLDQRIVDRFQYVVKRYPNRLAVKTPRVAWTYRELSRRASDVAGALIEQLRDRRGRGPRASGRVALLCSHDETMTAAVLGVLKAGHAYVPLDPHAPAARLAQMWADAEPSAIVATAAHVALAREIAGDAPVVVVDPAAALPRAVRIPRVPPGAPAYVLYTSGSTGEPKGVVQSHRNVLHFIRTYSANLQLRPADKLTLVAAYGFDAAVMDIFGALLNGAALCPFSLRDGTPQELADWIHEEAITVLHATPTVFRTLTSSLDPERVLSSVRIVVLGGEAAFRTDAEQFVRHFAPTCLLVNGLGPTESTIALQSFTAHGDRLTRSALPVGYPVDDTRVHLLDDHGYDAEVFGQIVVESPYVALGYWRRDDLTRAAFETVELDGRRRRYWTGDLARRLPGGRLEFLGRNDRQIKIRGYRIELGEIETVLAAHPIVRECAVTMATDARGAGRLVAYVVARDGDLASSRELRQFLVARLPDPMVPSAFVALEALPVRANGKVDRDALPPPRFEPSSAEYVPPRDGAEQRMADFWREVLSVDRVGVHDNFFELGGDSIKAIRITGLLRAAGVAITPWLLFQYQTIADLVPALAGAAPQDDSAAVSESSGDAFELTDDQLAQVAARVEFEVS